jgi:hypothetical protein
MNSLPENSDVSSNQPNDSVEHKTLSLIDSNQTAEESTPEPVPGWIVSLSEQLNTIEQKQRALDTKFDSKLRYDAQKDDTIKQLHADVEMYGRGIHLPLLRPLIEDLIRLYDAIWEFRVREFGLSELPEEAWQDEPLRQREQLRAQYIDSFLFDLEEAIRHNGFSPYTTQVGAVFEPRRHRSTDLMWTPDPSLEKHIAKSTRFGVSYTRPDGNEQIIRIENVVLYSCSPDLKDRDAHDGQ